ncbi:MAG: hypothetical protein Barrevirus3_2 [Barrevirus sp.]|uniref:Uncharacterized protein n=1 Tax=Barrevirus sp. TaxID=2487763 RepID=A0A3G4ZPQ4_9VIRU|nr:MAG: hypothetical protein Barrevirus3_2 [Barrevirus sp.]
MENYIFILILLAVLVIALMSIPTTVPLIRREPFTIPVSGMEGCSNCNERTLLGCGNCLNCGVCTTNFGTSTCEAGNKQGPYYKDDCVYWESNAPDVYPPVIPIQQPVYQPIYQEPAYPIIVDRNRYQYSFPYFGFGNYWNRDKDRNRDKDWNKGNDWSRDGNKGKDWNRDKGKTLITTTTNTNRQKPKSYVNIR